MSKSQELSLSEDIVFLPTSDFDPEFLHSEVERSVLESLLRDGPGAFYTKLSAHRIEPFLTPEEVNQVSSWVEDLHVEVVENGDVGSETGSGVQGSSDQYFPEVSDTPAPSLELGWPEKDRWDGVGQAIVYTNPPVEQAPHIREVIRRLLQGATMLIAIVADTITDCTVIRDLHSAASRGVVVYIILNRRPAKDNLTPNQLKHPNIIVRLLGGKTFITGSGKMVVGEMKENFVLVDLHTVVQGSYSLTWTDAHLHRQLVTVLSGPVVESFDREFRILYAASLPVPDSWKDAKRRELPNTESARYQPELNIQKQVQLDPCPPPSPPPPTADSPIDWEALGFFQPTEDSTEDQVLPRFTAEPLKVYRTGPVWHSGAPRAGVIDLHITEWQNDKMYRVAAEPRHLPEHQSMFWNMKNPERPHYGFLTERGEGPTMFRHRDFRMERNLMEDVPFSRVHRQDCLPSLDRSWEETMIPEEMSPEPAAPPAHHKKPIIVSIPQTDRAWNLGNILKKLNSDHRDKGLQSKMGKNTISKSTLDLSAGGAETLQRSQSQANLYDSFPMTPALALMKKRNDEVKSSLQRGPKSFLPLSRPRSFNLGLKTDTWKSAFQREQNNDEDDT